MEAMYGRLRINVNVPPSLPSRSRYHWKSQCTAVRISTLELYLGVTELGRKFSNGGLSLRSEKHAEFCFKKHPCRFHMWPFLYTAIRELKQHRRRRQRKLHLKSEVALLQTLWRLYHLVQFVECWQFFSGLSWIQNVPCKDSFLIDLFTYIFFIFFIFLLTYLFIYLNIAFNWLIFILSSVIRLWKYFYWICAI